MPFVDVATGSSSTYDGGGEEASCIQLCVMDSATGSAATYGCTLQQDRPPRSVGLRYRIGLHVSLDDQMLSGDVILSARE